MLTADPSKRLAGGPRTAAGKARSAQNAPRHGLDRTAAADPAFAPEIERLTLGLAAPGADPRALARIRAVAAAEVDLRRNRRARRDLFGSFAEGRPPSTLDLIKTYARLQSGAAPGLDIGSCALKGAPDLMSDPSAMASLIRHLYALERYERLAFSRRRSALRALKVGDAAEPGGREPHVEFAPRPARDGAHADGAQTDGAQTDGAPNGAPRGAPDSAPKTDAVAKVLILAERTPAPPPPKAEGQPQTAPAGVVQVPAGVVEAAGGGGSPSGPGADPGRPSAPCADPGPPVDDRPPADRDADELVAGLAFAGMPPDRIARRLGLSPEALQSRFSHALACGPDMIIAEVAAALRDRAVAGDTRAAIFILKSRAGWRDSGPVQNTPAQSEDHAAARRAMVAKVMKMLERRGGDG